jgi:hypothetical protein
MPRDKRFRDVTSWRLFQGVEVHENPWYCDILFELPLNKMIRDDSSRDETSWDVGFRDVTSRRLFQGVHGAWEPLGLRHFIRIVLEQNDWGRYVQGRNVLGRKVQGCNFLTFVSGCGGAWEPVGLRLSSTRVSHLAPTIRWIKKKHNYVTILTSSPPITLDIFL